MLLGVQEGEGRLAEATHLPTLAVDVGEGPVGHDALDVLELVLVETAVVLVGDLHAADLLLSELLTGLTNFFTPLSGEIGEINLRLRFVQSFRVNFLFEFGVNVYDLLYDLHGVVAYGLVDPAFGLGLDFHVEVQLVIVLVLRDDHNGNRMFSFLGIQVDL